MTTRRIRAILVLGLAALCAAPLLMPGAVPLRVRGAVVTLVSAGVFVAAVAAFFQARASHRWPMAALVAVVFAAWCGSDWTAPTTVSHMGGIAAGVVAMTVVLLLGRTPEQLQTTATWTSLAALVVLAAGLASMEAPPSKFLVFVNGAADQIRVFDTRVLPKLDYTRLGVQGGHVNPNALGGTALMLLPLGLGVAVAGRRATSRTAMAVGLLTVLGALLSVALSASRSAIYGLAVSTALFAMWRWRSYRSVLIALAVLAVAAVVASINPPAGSARAITVDQVVHSIGTRTRVWRQAAASLMVHPVLGVGLNNRDALPRQEAGPEGAIVIGDHEAHAHNQLLQVALDTGMLGLAAYLAFFGGVLFNGLRLARGGGAQAAIAGGAAFCLIALHVFGMVDAIALGAKVGVFQWIAAGLVIAAGAIHAAPSLR